MSAYYNEHDPFAAAWLRELIADGLIADGEVDERDIQTLDPADLAGYTQCHFFAGIGGWSLALRLAGWPDDRPVWTGSCPCQPFSSAGKSGGGGDSRHLWPAWYCLIRECRPPVVFGEQVESAVAHGWLDLVCDDMEREGYAIGAVSLPAASVGAPHIRQRLWFVANRDGTGLAVGNVTGERRAPEAAPAWREFERVHAARAWPSWSAESGDGVFVDGLPNIVGQVRGFGNAIVPQVAAAFIAAYQEVNQ